MRKYLVTVNFFVSSGDCSELNIPNPDAIDFKHLTFTELSVVIATLEKLRQEFAPKA